MFEKNDGKGLDNVAQNRFTAYVVVALRHTKRIYQEKKRRIRDRERPFDTHEGSIHFIYEPDMLESLTILDQLEDEVLQSVLQSTRERDLYIFTGKIIEGKSLRELSHDLGLGVNTVSAAYYRLIRRLRRELERDEHGI